MFLHGIKFRRKTMEQKRCLKCLQVITDPICLGCYTKQLNMVLYDIGVSAKTRKKILKKVQKNTEDGFVKDTCILCGKKDVAICSFCMNFRVTNILTGAGVSAGKIEMVQTLFGPQEMH